MNINWESELSQLLDRLATSQQQLLDLLANKHDLLQRRDHVALAALLPEEEAICTELQACHDHRQHLLDQAASEGLPADSIQSLAKALPDENAQNLQQPLDASVQRAKLLRHQSISQWVVVQQTLLHLSNMLEIIATGGQRKPTYGKGGTIESSGALMDQAV